MQYKRLLREMNQIINDIAFETTSDAKACTLTLIGFQGALRTGNENAEDIASFLEPLETA